MLKLVSDSDAGFTSELEIRAVLHAINKSSSLNGACLVAQKYFRQLDHDLVSVIFCSNDDTEPTIRPFRNLPQRLVDLAPKLQQFGGCPVKKEAQRLLQPFDWMTISKSTYCDFMSQRFLSEVQKLPYASIFAVPVVIGSGIGVFSVGIMDTDLAAEKREEIIVAVCQITTAMISRFPELSKLFEPKTLSALQASALLFAIQGLSNSQIAESLGIGEVATSILLKSAQHKLQASNLAQAVAKALAYGELSHMQIGKHDLI